MTAGGTTQGANAGQTAFSSSPDVAPSLVPKPPSVPSVEPPRTFGQLSSTTINGGSAGGCTVQ